jgi:hypothetical protein
MGKEKTERKGKHQNGLPRQKQWRPSTTARNPKEKAADRYNGRRVTVHPPRPQPAQGLRRGRRRRFSRRVQSSLLAPLPRPRPPEPA